MGLSIHSKHSKMTITTKIILLTMYSKFLKNTKKYIKIK